jgi:hypothetical protein
MLPTGVEFVDENSLAPAGSLTKVEVGKFAR